MENEKLKMENYKQTELGLIPEDWEVKEVKKIAKIYDGTHSTPNYVDYGIPFYSVEHITSNNFKNTKFISEEVFFNENKRVKLERGDILMSRIGDIGTAKYIDWDVNASFYVTLALFKKITEKIDFKFITFSINSSVFAKELHKRTLHVAFPKKINLGDIGKCKIPLPPLPEQKKIADCLSTWDSAIEKQNALINALTDRKKALMQQLLTGKKRLPGFSGEWKLNSINDLFIFKNGKAHENDIDENGKYILINSKFISTDGEILKKTNSNLAPLEVNDLVFVMSDVPNGKALAKFFLIKEDNLYTLNQRIGLLKIKKGNPIFMYYLLNRNSYFLMFDNGVGQTNLRKDDILDCPLNIPSLSEQTAIAEILATADRELTLQKEKLAQLQTQKKGLMQVLLTGKKRLLN
ncbi:hypothetical protein CMU80_07325 [Elizabethkingia anophelis]|nr:hypothetical protein [Elizabethkingia anophelis]